ncbi:MAG TPA: MlaD family protein [Opitutaceae bacterium]|nr:MlaD family protein [Opitutaceae bacterium]
MNNAQMSARVGLFFLLGIALIVVTFESLSDGKISRRQGYTLIAEFKSLKELKTGDEVRQAGVKIGSVVETRLHGRRAEAVLLVDSRIKIAQDASATIGMAGLLGSNYVSFDLGSESAAVYAPGDTVRSVESPDLNTIVTELGEVGKKVDQALSQFSGAMGGQDGNGLIGKLDRLVDTNSAKIGEITTNLKSVTAKIDRGEGTLGKLINDSKLHDELMISVGDIKSAAAQAKDFMTNAQSIIAQVKSGQGTLGVLLYDQDAGNNIKVVAKNLRELSDKLNQGQGTLGKLFSDDSLYLQAQGTLKKADRMIEGLDDQGPITAVGLAAKSLF